jgi:thiol-disulfide isomerase/thioredoxin
METNKLLAAVVLAIAVATPILAYKTAPREVIGQRARPAVDLPIPGQGLASLAGAGEWINSPPLAPAGLRGKVVLVDFWTYSCINWRRQLPYVRSWAEKYRDYGLVVIGVHTPEFPFEEDAALVRAAVSELKVPYPVVMDNEHRIWGAFANNAWPALYFIDAAGRVRHVVLGEGEYAESERLLQQLLAEAGANAVPRDLVAGAGKGAEAPADLVNLKSPETYVGYERTVNFASLAGIVPDKSSTYAIARKLRLNEWGLSGAWLVEGQRAIATAAHAGIAFRFHARDLHLVMGRQGAPVRFRVFLDGHAPGADHGLDVDEMGYGIATKPAMYQLIRQEGPVTDRNFYIEFVDVDAEAYSFTFG